MTTDTSTLQFSLRFIKSIKELEPEAWNNLVGIDYPFIQHEFLLALEESGCTSALTGWQPYHAVLELVFEANTASQSQPTLVALIPMYLKSNSSGEYVFDWAWADAFQQYGMQYYPKLVTAIPFTPSTGPRICIDSNYDASAITDILTKQITQHSLASNISSWHLLFPKPELSNTLRALDVQQRIGCQYQWFNNSFTSFEHFLDKFTSRKRKNIKKERSKIQADGIHFEKITGENISFKHWQIFFEFYQNTYFIRGRQPYLNLNFFKNIGASMPTNLLLVMAKKDTEYIAGALSFIGKNTLYGRYWGCIEEYQFLHFETCYYQGIEYCIENKIALFDSGAQGEHKIQRGFEPVMTYSNHWLAHPEFNKAVATFLKDEEKHIIDHIKKATEFLPFKQQS